MLAAQPNRSALIDPSPHQEQRSPSPSWRRPDHPTAHDRFRQIFRYHWHTRCDLRLEDEVPLDQRAYGNFSLCEKLLSSCLATAVRKTVERMTLCRDPNGGYARYVCPGCGFDRRVPYSCKTRFCPSCGKVRVDNRA